MADTRRMNPLSSGKRVYNGGSYSANRGQRLDPGGYIDRSMVQRAARRFAGSGMPTGGVAQKSLSNLDQSTNMGGSTAQDPQAQKAGEGGNPADVGGLAPLNLFGAQSQAQPPPLPDQASSQAQESRFGSGINPNVSKLRGFSVSAPDDWITKLSVAKMPGVPTSTSGQLKSPLDADLRMKRDQGYDQLNQSLVKLQSALQSLSGEYQSTLRDTETDRRNDYSQLAQKFAVLGGGGTAIGQDYGDLSTEYANFGSDLNRWFNEGQQGLLQDRTGAITNFNTLIRGLLGMQNQRAAEKAAAAALAKRTAAAKAKAARSSSSSSRSSRPSSSPRRASSGSSYRAPAKKYAKKSTAKKKSSLPKNTAGRHYATYNPSTGRYSGTGIMM